MIPKIINTTTVVDPRPMDTTDTHISFPCTVPSHAVMSVTYPEQ